MNFIIAHWLDITTTLLGLAYILLEYKASIWMWAVGAVMQILGIVLYYQKGVYADCGMEFYYLAMTAYGYWKWKKLSVKGGIEEERTPITHIPTRIALYWGSIFVCLWGIIWWLLTSFTDSTVPIADSFTTALSLVGIWALAHKYLEQWFVWIAVDIVTCVLYFHKDIPFKASLYGLYVIIAIFGYLRWRRMMSQQSTPLEGEQGGGFTDIIFDLGGVLLDLNMQGIGEACKRLGINPELFFVKADEDNTSTVCQGISASKVITEYQVGNITSEQFLEVVLSHCGEGITKENIMEVWDACIGLIPNERLDLIKELRKKGYHTHLLSNTNDLHWEEIKRRYFSEEGYTCEDLFDHVFVSHEMHLAKPNPEIYHQAVREIGRPAEQCFFIDDAQVNVEAAKNEGLKGAWLDLSNQDSLKSILKRFTKDFAL